MDPISLAYRALQSDEEETVEIPEETLTEEIIPTEEVEKETHYLSQSILTMLAIVAVNAVALGYLRKAKTKYPRVGRYVQDATVTTLIGILAGMVLQLANRIQILTMIGDGYQNFFMIILLPPIIFESAINMHKKSFFKNIGTILMFAVVGTFIAACLTAFGIFLVGLTGLIPEFEFTVEESFAFGSLISSTDPVSVLAIFKEMSADKTLYSLIFGESILNDAIAIVLYNTVTALSREGYTENYLHPVVHFILLLFGSILIGFIIGLTSAMILKIYFGKSENNNSANTETTLMIVLPWVAYLIGEAFDMSGVVTLLFCGISMTKYALPYLSEPGRQLTQSLYSTLSSTAETLAFIFIGIGFFSFEHHWARLRWVILFLSFLIIIGARYAQITIISAIANLFRNQNKITKSFKMVMTYSGFRGAMAFALATNAINVYKTDGAGSMMLTLTLVYAALTIFVQGSLLVPVMEYFKVIGNPEYIEFILNLIVNRNESLVLDDEDPLKATTWRFKGAFYKLENFIARMLLKSKDESDELKGDVLGNMTPQKNSAKFREMSLFGKRENEANPVRRIRSDSDANAGYSQKCLESHNL